MAEAAPRYHIMHVLESLEVGGMENGVVNLANLIDDRLFRVTICCLSHPGSLSARLRDGVDVVSLNWRGGVQPRLFLSLYRLFRERGVDVVHTHGWLSLFYSSLAALPPRGRLIVNGEHGQFNLDRFRRRALYRLLSPLTARYVAVSYSLQESLKLMLPGCQGKILTVPNGVDCRLFRPATSEEIAAARGALGIPVAAKVIGSAGRLDPIKNYPLLLQAVALLGKRHGDLHCLLIGDGPCRKQLEELAVRLGIGHLVHFAGRTETPQLLLPVLDVFVLTSLSEGMSNAVLEAMSCGIAVVATRVGDNEVLVDDGESGFLVASGDCAGLCAALDELLVDEGKRGSFGGRGRQAALAKYALGTMVSSYQDVYLSCLESRRSMR